MPTIANKKSYRSDYSVDTLVASAPRTTSGDSGAWDGLGAASTLRVQLDITAVSGTSPSMTVVIEDSLDGTNWNTIDTFPAKTAVNREVRDVLPSAKVWGDLVRVRWTITGTSPSFTFSVIVYSATRVG